MIGPRQVRRGGRLLRLVPLAEIFLMVVSAGAEDAKKGWEPAPPMPDTFDWIQLVSGEWLKGEIIAMYRDSLEFDSDELDQLTLDFGDISQVRSAGVMQLGLSGGRVATGRLLVEGNDVRVLGDQEQRFRKEEILSITSGEPKERNFWSGKVSVGANFRGGNTEQVETNSRVGIQRRTVKNRAQLDYLANYNITNDVTATDNQRASVGWDRFLTDRFFLSPLLAEYYRDPFQNIAHRGSIGAGAGYQIMDTPKVDWQATAGIAYQNTRFDDVLEGEPTSASTPALIMGTVYAHELTGWLDLSVQYQIFLVNKESGQYSHHFVTGLAFDVVGSLDFDVTYVWDRIQKPRTNSDGNIPRLDDSRLNFALGFDF